MGTRGERRAVTSVSTKTPPGCSPATRRPLHGRSPCRASVPGGPVSGLRMLSFFINRAGRQLTRSRQAELENAKRLMRKTIETERARP
jgi:Protein of unknown function (DUF3175)